MATGHDASDDSLRYERVHGTRYATRAQAEAGLLEYIAIFYNRRRLDSTLGYNSPTQFLTDWISTRTEEELKAAYERPV